MKLENLSALERLMAPGRKRARVHEGFLEDTAEPAADDTFIQENLDNCVPVPPWRQAAAAEEEEIALMRGPASGSELAEMEAASAKLRL